MFVRPIVREKGMERISRAGDGILGNPRLVNQAADSAQVIPVASLLGGVYTRSAIAAGRIDTTDTAVAILAAMPDMDIGDSFILVVSNTAGFSLTLAGGVGVTASGNLVVLTLTSKIVIFTKTAATTMDMVAL